MDRQQGDDGDQHLPAPWDLAAALHEATNALTVITGWIERARHACSEAPEASAALDRALDHAHRARKSIRRAIGARIQESASEPAAAVAERMATDLAVEAQRAAVLLRSETTGNAGHCHVAHPDSVCQVLANLLLNAIAVSPPGGTVHLEVSQDDGNALFAVQDEGPGVAPTLRGHIFEGKQSHREGGAGIGLRHAHAIAAQHGGRLELVDSAVGARFCLWWPACAPPEREPASPPAKPATGPKATLHGNHVLLLEDDAAVIELLRLTLQARGAEVTAVSNAPRLREALATRRFDILLVDLSPLHGALDEAVAAARSANQQVEVVVISGSVTVQPRPDVLWIRKPFEPGELVDAIVRNRAAGPAGAAPSPSGA